MVKAGAFGETGYLGRIASWDHFNLDACVVHYLSQEHAKDLVFGISGGFSDSGVVDEFTGHQVVFDQTGGGVDGGGVGAVALYPVDGLANIAGVLGDPGFRSDGDSDLQGIDVVVGDGKMAVPIGAGPVAAKSGLLF